MYELKFQIQLWTISVIIAQIKYTSIQQIPTHELTFLWDFWEVSDYSSHSSCMKFVFLAKSSDSPALKII